MVSANAIEAVLINNAALYKALAEIADVLAERLEAFSL